VSILRGILISRVKLHARTAGEIKVLISGVSLERLCYAAGSTHVPQSRAIFEVKKSTGQESSQAVSQPPTEEQGKEKEILSITIFRELRGSSEVVIFLSPSPVRACESMSAAGTIPCVPPRRLLPSWETKILAAQNIIFNQELFSHLTKEAYNTKTTLPYEVYTDRIIVPLSLNPPCWLSIHHVREYDDNKQKLKVQSLFLCV
jgi:hypothetical protein